MSSPIGDDPKALASASAAAAEQPKTKKSKTFTGCYTCRSRKIRCDLGRPVCQRCLKSKVQCLGYDINLRWSEPIRFTKTGDAISLSAGFFPKSSDSQEDGPDGPTEPTPYTHRRHVGFVRWDKERHYKPYKYYDEMDSDLGALHSSSNDPMVSKSKTKMLGPFGAFQGSVVKPRKRTTKNAPKYAHASPGANSSSTAPGVGTVAGAAGGAAGTGGHVGGPAGGPVGRPAGGAGGLTTPTLGPVLRNKALSRTVSSRSLLSNPEDPTDKKFRADTFQQDQLWLSNELRDDALLTAAALNGDAQFLDFMSTLSTPNSNIYMPVKSTNYNSSTNQNDFLNLVFHRNHSFQTGPGESPMPMSLAGNSMLADSFAQPQQHQQQTAQAQAAFPAFLEVQDQYYSNYSDYYYNNPYKQNEDLEIHLHASSARHNSRVANNVADENGPKTDIVEGEQLNSTTMPSSIMRTVQSMLEPELGFEITIPPSLPENQSQNQNQSIATGLPSTALQVQPLTRYLLNYYVTLVADLMTVIPLTENPWKSIYFPRALMAIGELLALGHTSDAKNALLNALLAVLAFNLQSKFPKNSNPMKYYLNLGIRLRNQASVFVKKLLNSSGGIENCVRTEKYKDVLCAVMSMISVDLVWGTMQDTNYYINWCGKVISTKMINKKKLSTKARILHRIFGSLKLIQDSTCLDIENINNDHERYYDINGDKYGNGNDNDHSKPGTNKNKIDFLLTSKSSEISETPTKKSTSLAFFNKKLINTKKNDENFATDALYGLPNSLIILFSETVSLVRINLYHKQANSTLPSTFQNEVYILNEKLQNWKLDWILQANSGQTQDEQQENWTESKFLSPMHEATFHHTMSFYHALKIYFSRLVLGMHGDKLQDSVKKVLDHLNAIEVLIAKKEANIIPLFWQGFMAGCEAISQELQMAFKKWGADIAQYLGSYWGARQIMLEVWRRKRMNEGRDDWVSVIQDWEMNLMLN